jgi:hypothetical protein
VCKAKIFDGTEHRGGDDSTKSAPLDSETYFFAVVVLADPMAKLAPFAQNRKNRVIISPHPVVQRELPTVTCTGDRSVTYECERRHPVIGASG